MGVYLTIILVILIGDYALDFIVETFNLKHLTLTVPQEFQGYYDQERYRTSQKYLKERTKFGLISSAFFTSLTVAFILMGGFNFLDQWARSFNGNSIITGLIFAAAIVFGSRILHIPFSLYSTFVIEEKYGFNRMTPKIFITDFFKGIVLTSLIGGIAFSIVLWFFETAGPAAWLYCWGIMAVFELFILFIAPVVIMPLFNKFVPLEDGELKQKIEAYAQKEKFALQGVYTMDGSKRSTKSNAFFTGFGKYRRIVLFDTLIQKHTVDELVSVLAHEMGHYKKKHIFKHIGSSIITMGMMFYVLSFFINNPDLFAAFRMENTSIYASLFFFGLLYTPVNMLLSIFQNVLSRKYEYESDRYAVLTYKQPQAMIDALKKLTVDNLSNLTPHPVKVFLEYSHPPVLKRIEAIKNIGEIQ